MGPFRLMDLIGIDVNTAAARSIYEQSFGEPRYRPHWLRVQMLEQGALGRKTGRGFYRYAEDEPEFGPPTPPEVGKATGEVWISKGGWGPGFGELAQKAGYRLVSEMKSNPVAGVMIAGRGEGLREWVGRFDETLPPAVPLLVQSVDTSLTEISTWAQNRERLVGFDGWFFAQGSAATLVSNPQLDEMIKVAASKFAESLGRVPVWVKETPALVLPRVVAMLVNEAAFAQLEGIADPDTIDRAMQLGANYPHGPLAWGKRLGYAKVLTVLDHLRAEYGEERYRACTLLRRWARLEENIAASG